jgi:two-component system, NarL family, response regulator NreC
MTAPPRVLLADDHELVLGAFEKMLSGECEIVGRVSDGRALLGAAEKLRPDVIVLDIGMPLLNGIDATAQIVRRVPEVKVLILSMHSQEQYVSRALQAGAKGYLLKDSAGTDLIKAIATIASGKTFFSPAVAKLMLDDYVRRVAETKVIDKYDSLSEREREIFQLIAEARSNKEVAEMLGISVATVETHRARILEKLDVHNTAELVLYAVRRGVIS